MDYHQLIIELIASKGFDKLYSNIESYLKKKNKSPIYDKSYFIDSLKQNLTKTVNWSKNITYGINAEDTLTEDIYVDLDYYDFYPRESVKSTLTLRHNLLTDVLTNTNKHIILLGEGGSGKSTAMQMIANKMLTEENYLPEYTFPLVIRLREHNETFSELSSHVTIDNDIKYPTYKGNLLFWTLYKEIGISYRTSESISENMQYHLDIQNGFVQKYVIEVLNFLKPVLILDGFDELNSTLKPKLFLELNELFLSLTNSRVILTSRTGEFEHYSANAKKVKLAPFDDHKIFSFCKIWMKDEQRGTELFEAIKKTPFYDTTIRPINLTHLAILYKANDSLPVKPKAVYYQLINLHISKWDNIRNIKRSSEIKNVSDLTKFDSSIKYDFLTHLAYHLSIANYLIFDRQKLFSIFENELANRFDLKHSQFDEVINEIELHTGLFIQKLPELYEFPHKSIHEFLTAEYISKFQPFEQIQLFIKNLPNELAIATCLSTNPNYLFGKVFELLLNSQIDTNGKLYIYLVRLFAEKPDFTASAEMGYKIICFWQKIHMHKNLVDVYLSFIYLNGFKESISMLQDYYQPDAGISSQIKTIKKEIRTQNASRVVVNIVRKPNNKNPLFFLKSFNAPLLFVQEWKTICKYL